VGPAFVGEVVVFQWHDVLNFYFILVTFLLDIGIKWDNIKYKW
jgi:hypothetical protein